MSQLEEEELIRLLQSMDNQKVDQGFRLLYEYNYPSIVKYITSRNGQKHDADDVLQEGLLVLYKMVRQEKLQGIKSLQKYLFTVCKHFWYRKQKGVQPLSEPEEKDFVVPENPMVLQHIFAQERSNLLDKLLQQLGDSCRTLLIYFYYDQLSIKEILVKMHYNSEAALKNKKSKCMKKLRSLCDDNPQLKKRIQ